MGKRWKALALVPWVFLVGCTPASNLDHKADRTQNPAKDARWLTLIVKAGDGIEPQPVTLEYESEKCEEPRSYGVGGQSQSGVALMRASHYEKISLDRAPENHVYKARFAIDAGGSCQWKLVSLETSFKYRSHHPLAQGKEAISNREKFAFRSEKDSVRTPNVRVNFEYFPVVYLHDHPSENRFRLQKKSMFFPPSLDPSESGTMTLEPKVFGDMAMTVGEDPQSRRNYVVAYPDGAKGTSWSRDVVGVEDKRMQCLLSPAKQNCARFSPIKR
ncbi:hypothetical protein [Comamonas odontotermitis]|uniref:hypothetical protein n=1 Tax=Comamonas odontotermitis TaxID=379895 RepID=UPI001CC35696|nr:hypothetical protein [Comamonas odontotermitis]UBB17701.1 hypothetical protein LAD35_03370 [Comamonas odontotermitis]